VVTLFTSLPDLSVVFFSLLFVCFCCVFGAFFHLLLLPFWRIKMYNTFAPLVNKCVIDDALSLIAVIVCENF